MNTAVQLEAPCRLTGQIETLLLDDDIWSLRLLSGLLQTCFPDMKIETRETPDWRGEFDVYFIDNEFEGKHLATDLARKIRRANPEALIIAFSATLDSECLKGLINAGCDGACDKSIPADLTRAMDIVQVFIENAKRRLKPGVPARKGLAGAVESIRDLLREWNSRLDQQAETIQEGESR